MDYLNNLLNNVIEDAINVGIPISSKIIRTIFIDKKRYDRVGACYRYRFPERYEIHLSEDVLNANENEIKSIIAHEILHTCFLSMSHDGLWQKYQKIMNNHYEYDIKIKYSWNNILKNNGGKINGVVFSKNNH